MNKPPTSNAERAAEEYASVYELEETRRLAIIDFIAGTEYEDQEKDKLIVDLQKVIAELKSCPNESWECAKEQRRLNSEIEQLTSKLIEIKDLCEMELSKHNG